MCVHNHTHWLSLMQAQGTCVWKRRARAAGRQLRTHTASLLRSSLMALKVAVSQGRGRPFNIWVLGNPAPLYTAAVARTGFSPAKTDTSGFVCLFDCLFCRERKGSLLEFTQNNSTLVCISDLKVSTLICVFLIYSSLYPKNQ